MFFLVLPPTLRRLYFRHTQTLKGEYLDREIALLRQHETWPVEKLQKEQWKEVRQVVRLARKTPFWRERLRTLPLDFTLEEWQELPILSKEELRSQADSMMLPCETALTVSTSGSTGQATVVRNSREGRVSGLAWQWSAREWFGVHRDDPGCWIYGRPLSKRQKIMSDVKALLNNFLIISAYDLSDSTLERHWRRIQRMRPRYFYGYPSALNRLAEYLEATDQRPNWRVCVVITTGEILGDEARQRIGRAFDAPVANEYGCAEIGPVAFECPHGNWHLALERAFVEWIRPDGTPASPGERAQIVLTSLHAHAMPLLRYSVGDWGALGEHACPCGRPYPLMSVEVGRSMDAVRTLDGRLLSPVWFVFVQRLLRARNLDTMAHFRVTQRALDDFLLEYVSSSPEQELEALDLFRHELCRFVGADIHLHAQRVSFIAPEKSGKLRFFIPLRDAQKVGFMGIDEETSRSTL